MATTTQKEELRQRVEAKRKRLEAKLSEAKADASESSRKSQAWAQKKLDALNESLRDGWDNLSEGAVEKLNEWLKDDEKERA